MKTATTRAISRAALLAAVLATELLLSQVSQAASPAAKVRAQQAFEQAVALLKSAQTAKACPLLETSERLDPAMGTKYQLARCYERDGRLASAWRKYQEVVAAARAAKMADREKWASERAAALAPRLSRLTVVVAAKHAAMDSLTVQHNGNALERAHYNKAITVDGGSHHLVAKLGSRVVWNKKLSVATEGAKLELRLEFSPEPKVDPTRVSGVINDPSAQPAGSSQRIAGWIVGGLGIGSVLAGGALAVAAKVRYDGSDDHCVGTVCDAEGVEAGQSARVQGTAATALLGVGGAALCAGLAVWLTAPSAEPSGIDSAIHFGIAPSPDGAWLTVGGQL